MTIDTFVACYKDARNILGKRQITDQYIENAAFRFKAKIWDESIFIDMFDELKVENPLKVDISANAIRTDYWKRYYEKNTDKAEWQQCKKGLCDGYGIVPALNKDDLEYAFKCSCFLGQQIKGLATWGDDCIRRGYKLRFEQQDTLSTNNEEDCRKEYYFLLEFTKSPRFMVAKPEVKKIILDYANNTYDTSMTLKNEKELGHYVNAKLKNPFEGGKG